MRPRSPMMYRIVELADRVSSWSLRKARMFTDNHVRVAADRLADRHLLPA